MSLYCSIFQKSKEQSKQKEVDFWKVVAEGAMVVMCMYVHKAEIVRNRDLFLAVCTEKLCTLMFPIF